MPDELQSVDLDFYDQVLEFADVVEYARSENLRKSKGG